MDDSTRHLHLKEKIEGFVERVGGTLVEPRTTLTQVSHGGPGGLSDLFLLLTLQIFAVHLPQIVRGVIYLAEVGYQSGITLLLNTVAGVVAVPFFAVIIASVVMGALTRGKPARQHNLDLAALCMIPAVFLQLAMSLLVVFFKIPPPRWLALAVIVAGGVWFVALIRTAVQTVRRSEPGA